MLAEDTLAISRGERGSRPINPLHLAGRKGSFHKKEAP
jgi:hypothetical protein